MGFNKLMNVSSWMKKKRAQRKFIIMRLTICNLTVKNGRFSMKYFFNYFETFIDDFKM